MIQKFLRMVDSPVMFGFRLTLLACICFFIPMSVALGWQADVNQPNQRYMEMMANEHRLSVLETDMATLKAKIDDLTFHSYLELLALSGIIGETGIRVLKGKKQ